MNKKEVLKLIEAIEKVYDYPFTRKRNQFNKHQTDQEVILSIVEIWHDILRDKDAEKVLKRFKQHVLKNKYPPTIAEIIPHEMPKNDFLEQSRRWRMDAKQRKQRKQPSKPPWA